jgi:hypothetical protein
MTERAISSSRTSTWQKALATRREGVLLAQLAVALILAYLGQQRLSTHKYWVDGILFFGVALVLFWRALPRGDAGLAVLRRPRVAAYARSDTLRLWLLGLAIVGGTAAFLLSGHNTFRRSGVLAWLIGMAALPLAVSDATPATVRTWLADRWVRLRDSWRDGPRISWFWVLFGLIFLLAAFFRFYRLAAVPAEMTSDHAEKLLDVYDVLHGQHHVFFPRNTGREPWQMYMTVAVMALFNLPLGHLALKVGTSLVSLLTIPAVYFLGREAFDREMGLVAAALVSVSTWHISISRVGLRFPLTALPVALSLGFLFRALRTNRRLDYVWCGLFFGLGLYGYTPIRILPLAIAGCVLVKLVLERDDVQRWGWDTFAMNLALVPLATAVAFAPLGRYMVDNPQMFWYRALSRAPKPGTPWPEIARLFVNSLGRTLLMFNWLGDVVWVNTVPLVPALSDLCGALLVLGVFFAIWRLVRRRQAVFAYLLVSGLVLLLPSTLSLAFPNENPSVVRAAGAIPVIFLLVAVPLALLLHRLRRCFGELWGRRVGLAVVTLLILLLARHAYGWYFVTYDQQYRRSAQNSTEMAQVLLGFVHTFGDMQHVYHKAYPYWVDTRAIAINMGDITWGNAILDIKGFEPQLNDPAAKMYLVHPQDREALAWLSQHYPDGYARTIHSKTPGKDFIVYFVPARKGAKE